MYLYIYGNKMFLINCLNMLLETSFTPAEVF